jgi:membrane protein DedA with SNARE-associated domain
LSSVVFLALPATGIAYLLLFVLVGGESAGVPLPGETALITASVLASQGKLSLPLVIATAASAAIIGDNFGYLLGRHGARRLLERPGWLARRRLEILRRGEEFFERHGGKTVFLGRWLPILRITAAWLAGAHHMPWPKFLAWNAAGGIAWAVSVGILAYLTGEAAEAVVRTAGYVALGVFTVVLVALVAWAVRRARARSSASGGSR